MRLRYAAGLLAAICLALAAACGSGSGSGPGVSGSVSPGQASGSVTMWIYPIDPVHEQADWAPRVAAFERAYPHVKVNVIVQPWANRDEQLATAIAGGKGPDVVYMIPDQIPNYAHSGALSDVGPLVAADKSDFRPSTLAALTYDGTLYGVPLLTQVTTLYGNKKVMKAAGIAQAPRTWAQLLADAPKIKAAGYYATEYRADPAETLNGSFYPLLWQAGGQVLSPDGRHAAFNSSAGVAALTFIQTLVKNGYVPKDPLTTTPAPDTDPVFQGKVAFVLNENVASMTPTAQSPLSDWAAYPPLSGGPGGKAIDYGTVGGLSVLSGSPNKAAASAWVKWITSPAQEKSYDLSQNYLSPRLSAGTLYSPKTLIGQEEKMLPYMTQGSINLASRQIITLLSSRLQAAILNQTPPRQALNAAAAAVNGLLSRSGG